MYGAPLGDEASFDRRLTNLLVSPFISNLNCCEFTPDTGNFIGIVVPVDHHFQLVTNTIDVRDCGIDVAPEDLLLVR